MDLRSRSTVLIAAAAVTFLAGLAAGRGLSGSPEVEPGDDDVVQAPHASITTRDGAPASPSRGFPHSREGAVEAATSYGLALDGPRLLDASRRSALLRDISSDGARADLESTLARGADLIVTNLGLTEDRLDDPGFVWRVVPGGWQVRSYDGTRATVAIWATGVVLADDQPLAMPEWRTTEVELVWERDDWRLVGFTTTPGPAPSLAGKVAGDGVATRINAFTPYRLSVADPTAGATR
jgi:hypothetical protein